MKLRQIETVRSEKIGKFRTACTVMLDTLLNKTYDLKITKLEDAAKIEYKTHPKLSKTTAFFTRYVFWYCLSQYSEDQAEKAGASSNKFIKQIGPIAINSVLSAHLWFVSFIWEKSMESIKAIHERLRTGAWQVKDEIKPVLKPTLPIYIGLFGLIDIGYLLLHDTIATSIARLSPNPLSPMVAASAVIIGTVGGLILDSMLFFGVWTKKALAGIPQKCLRSEIKDFWKGIRESFTPLQVMKDLAADALGLFKSSERKKDAEPKPPESAGEYAGQLYGTMESHYIWIQGLRVFVAFSIAVDGIAPSMLVTRLWADMTKYFYIVSGIIAARYYEAIGNRIEENNKHLGLE